MKKILIAAAVVLVGAIIYAFTSNKEDKTEKKDAPAKELVVQMTKDLYQKDIADLNNTKGFKYKGKKPAIIDFYADWCGPCRQVAPLLKELAKEYQDKIIVYRVNVDNEKELATTLGIQSLPTIVFIPMKGDPQAIVGSAGKDTFKKAIEEVLLGKPAK